MTREQAIELIRQQHGSIQDVLDEINRRTLNGDFDYPGWRGPKGAVAGVDMVERGEETIRLVLAKFSKGAE